MPPVKNMDVLLTAARSRGIRCFLSLQSFFQLEKNYSQHSTRDGMWADSSSQSVQMIKRRLMTPGEIMSLPQGQFILRKAGAVSASTQLALYWDYLKQYPEPRHEVHYELRSIQCLTSESIRRTARLKKNALRRK